MENNCGGDNLMEEAKEPIEEKKGYKISWVNTLILMSLMFLAGITLSEMVLKPSEGIVELNAPLIMNDNLTLRDPDCKFSISGGNGKFFYIEGYTMCDELKFSCENAEERYWLPGCIWDPKSSKCTCNLNISKKVLTKNQYNKLITDE